MKAIDNVSMRLEIITVDFSPEFLKFKDLAFIAAVSLSWSFIIHVFSVKAKLFYIYA